MHWSLILLMVFTALLVITSAALFIMWILLKTGRIPQDLLTRLDAPGLERMSRRALWGVPALVLLALAGLALVIFLKTLVWIIAGSLALSLSMGASTALLVIRETSRYAQRKASS
jgi:hypothetical protein